MFKIPKYSVQQLIGVGDFLLRGWNLAKWGPQAGHIYRRVHQPCSVFRPHWALTFSQVVSCLFPNLAKMAWCQRYDESSGLVGCHGVVHPGTLAYTTGMSTLQVPLPQETTSTSVQTPSFSQTKGPPESPKQEAVSR